ncbi:MAG: hypothetical protein ACE5EF_01090 [Dehalococcoidia bacterium]
MLTENGVQIDYAALEKILGEADVVVIGFTFTAGRLLVDTRSTADTGPLVAPVGPVKTIQERYLWLGQHRPEFGSPEDFSFFVWPRTMRSLLELESLPRLLKRLDEAEAGSSDSLRNALAAFADLELRSMRAAVRGEDSWQTIWSAAAPS